MKKLIVETDKRPIFPIKNQVSMLVIYTFLKGKGKSFTVSDMVANLSDEGYTRWKDNMKTKPEQTIQGLLSIEVSEKGIEKPLNLPYFKRMYVPEEGTSQEIGRAHYYFENVPKAKAALLSFIEELINLLGHIVNIEYEPVPNSNKLELTVESIFNYEGLSGKPPAYYLDYKVIDELVKYYHMHRGYFEAFLPYGIGE